MQREGNPGTADIIMLCAAERFQAGGYFAALASSPSLNACTFKVSGFQILDIVLGN